MPVIRFLGRVLPPGVYVNSPNLEAGSAQRGGNKAEWQLAILDNNVTLAIVLDKYSHEHDFEPCMALAQSVSESIAYIYSLQTGVGISVLFERAIKPNGELIWPYGIRPELPKLLTALTDTSDYKRIIQFAIEDHTFAMILHDITDGLRHRYTGVIGVARAMEGICTYFIPTGGTREDGWPRMRAALNASKLYLQSITNMSRGSRHADWTGDDKEADKVFERAWTLFNRFYEYRKRGDQSLPDTDFPLLELSHA
jgi:hypothetical protein